MKIYLVYSLLFLFMSSSINADEINKLKQAVQTLESSKVNKELLAATKTIIDSQNLPAWKKLVTFFNNRRFMFNPTGDEVTVPVEKLYSNFYDHINVVYKSQNPKLLVFLELLGDSHLYKGPVKGLEPRESIALDLFEGTLMKYKNKDKEYYRYITKRVKKRNTLQLEEILIASGQEKNHNIVAGVYGYDPNKPELFNGKRILPISYYIEYHLSSIVMHRDKPYNFSILAKAYFIDKEQKYLYLMVEPKAKMSLWGDEEILAVIDPDNISDCDKYILMLQKLLALKNEPATTAKYRPKIKAMLARIKEKKEVLTKARLKQIKEK